MKEIAVKYPADAEVQTLYADAIMNTMPMGIIGKRRNGKPQTGGSKEGIWRMCFKISQSSGAHHLYIHLVEASPTPELA